MKFSRFALCSLFASAFLFNSCVKQTFDAPPDTSQVDPNLPVNLSISKLSNIALGLTSGQSRVLGDSTIYGVITADDRTGNFYKTLVIQDSTGGIAVSISATGLYADYPIGRKIYIKLKGLTVVNYHGLPEIALTATTSGSTLTVTGIPSTLLTTYLVKASYPNVVTPLKIRLDDLVSDYSHYLNRLVEINNMQFDSSVVGLQYAAPSILSISTTRILRPCPNPNNSSLQLYNSGFATFQPAIVPGNKLSVTGIFSYYGSNIQFLIRDTSDIKITAVRDCR